MPSPHWPGSGAGDAEADEVARDERVGHRGAFGGGDVDAGAVVARDDVAGAGGRAADGQAGCGVDEDPGTVVCPGAVCRVPRPSARVPIRFPATVMFAEPAVTHTPRAPFPEITLPGPSPGVAVRPPRVSPVALRIRTPITLPKLPSPRGPVPMKLPSIRTLARLSPVTSTPAPVLPEMTLRAPEVAPPTVRWSRRPGGCRDRGRRPSRWPPPRAAGVQADPVAEDRGVAGVRRHLDAGPRVSRDDVAGLGCRAPDGRPARVGHEDPDRAIGQRPGAGGVQADPVAGDRGQIGVGGDLDAGPVIARDEIAGARRRTAHGDARRRLRSGRPGCWPASRPLRCPRRWCSPRSSPRSRRRAHGPRRRRCPR